MSDKDLNALSEMIKQSQESRLFVGKRRRNLRTPKPTKQSLSAQRFYRSQLMALLKEMNKDVRSELIPSIELAKRDYVADAWFDSILDVVQRLASKWAGRSMQSQMERIAMKSISMADAANRKDFIESINRSVGIDMSGMLRSESLDDYISITIRNNVSLIKSIPEQYFNELSQNIENNIRQGFTPANLEKSIREMINIRTFKPDGSKSTLAEKVANRAKLIARDQTAKINGDLTRIRQKDAGITHFKWVTSKDERVGDDHKLAARRRTKYGIGIYKWSEGAPEGFPGNADRPNCRCTATPMIKGVNWDG